MTPIMVILVVIVVALAETAAADEIKTNANSVLLRKKLLDSGDFKWELDPKTGPDAIRILGDWVKENIIGVEVPQLKALIGPKSGRIQFHKSGADQLKKAFAEIEEKKLVDRVLTWDGSFSPHMVRGSIRIVGNHSFGTAFDINYAWNRLGRTPAPVGSQGSVIELVPIFEKHGFFWGGRNSSRPEGCHFELFAQSDGPSKP